MLIKIRIINEEKWRNIIKIRIKIRIINEEKWRFYKLLKLDN